MMGTRTLYSLAARWLALTASSWSSIIGIFSPTSLAGRVADGSDLADALNWVILVMTALGWADVVWHDIRGKLIWPSFDPYRRHQICVMLYAGLAAMSGMRAFAAVTAPFDGAVMITGYYVITAIGIGFVATAIAIEARSP